MLLSMTGYGTAVATHGEKTIHVEVKSLNSKAMDLNVRMPSLYREHELEVRSLATDALVRGKVDVIVWTEHGAAGDAMTLNTAQLQSYHDQITQVARAMQLPPPADWMPLLLHMPDVIVRNDTLLAADDEWQAVAKALQDALDRVTDFRRQEGEALQKLFTEKVNNIGALLSGIAQHEASRTEKIRTRIEEALKTVANNDYDHNRLEQELIYYIEKLDISEERQRLGNHLSYFLTTMNGDGPHGKKLGFIAQEMGREINTTGSKSNHAEMQNIVVRMKDELEQIKEQVLNVL